MSRITRRSRLLSLVLAGALVVVAPLTLSGCGLIGNVADQNGIDLGGNELPSDFPDEVPLIDGEVVFGAAIGGDSGRIWNVTIRVDGDGVLDQITGQFEDAGFTPTPVTETTDGSAITFTKEPFGVFVVLGQDDEGNQVAIYTVTRSSDG
jgi:hypothetical protein